MAKIIFKIFFWISALITSITVLLLLIPVILCLFVYVKSNNELKNLPKYGIQTQTLDWYNIYDLPSIENSFEYKAKPRGIIDIWVMRKIYSTDLISCSIDPNNENDLIYHSEKDIGHFNPDDYYCHDYMKFKNKCINNHSSIKIIYNTHNSKYTHEFGSYITIYADLSEFNTMTFMVKGKNVVNSPEIIMVDDSKIEDTISLGLITDFLKNDITEDWQVVKIDLNKYKWITNMKAVISIAFQGFEGQGALWIKDMRFYRK